MSTLLPRNTIVYYPVTTSVIKGEGTKTEGAASSFIGSVQPTTGKDFESTPSLRQDIGTVKIYSDTQLNVSIAGTTNSGDIVIWQGQRWEITDEMKFQNGLINHYKYFGEYRAEGS